MTYIVSGGALNSTHSLTHSRGHPTQSNLWMNPIHVQFRARLDQLAVIYRCGLRLNRLLHRVSLVDTGLCCLLQKQ